MTTLLIALAFGLMLAVFWSVIARIGTDFTSHNRRTIAIHSDPER
jgi:hypothetical protein